MEGTEGPRCAEELKRNDRAHVGTYPESGGSDGSSSALGALSALGPPQKGPGSGERVQSRLVREQSWMEKSQPLAIRD